MLGDGMLGQMMEPVVLPAEVVDRRACPPKPWATNGAEARRARNVINSLYIDRPTWSGRTCAMQRALSSETRPTRRASRRKNLDDADDRRGRLRHRGAGGLTRPSSRPREEGIRVGLFRPITLFPFPSQALARLAATRAALLVVEMSMGQMVEDVRLAVRGRVPGRVLRPHRRHHPHAGGSAGRRCGKSRPAWGGE